MTDGPAVIDLHTHSNRSDGALAPAELVTHAALAGVQVLALTDHDTVAGLPEAQRAADEQGVRLVPGVELTAAWRAQDVHVLGLWIDPDCAILRTGLIGQGDLRRKRLRAMCDRLSSQGLPGAQLLAAVENYPGVPTRTHLAHAMVEAGIIDSTDRAFRKHLRNGATHIAAAWPSLAVVVGWICAAGGVAALAHPKRYPLSGTARRLLLRDFAASGGTVLEIVTGANGAQHAAECAELAARHGLKGSVGSDFHDPKATWNPLGRSLELPAGVTPIWRSFGLNS